jgi:hypothetical protein
MNFWCFSRENFVDVSLRNQVETHKYPETAIAYFEKDYLGHDVVIPCAVEWSGMMFDPKLIKFAGQYKCFSSTPSIGVQLRTKIHAGCQKHINDLS